MSVRRHTWDGYKNEIGECSNPDCEYYDQLEAHHIIPIRAGGSDNLDNIIILCRSCHMGNGYHSDWDVHYDKLHQWKNAIDSHIMDELR